MKKEDLQTVRDALTLMRYNGIKIDEWDGKAIDMFDAAIAIIDADLTDTSRIEQIKSAAESIYSENEMNVLTLEDSIADLAGTPRPAHPAQDVEARVHEAYRQGLEDAASKAGIALLGADH